MRLDEKAKENLEASTLLLEGGDDYPLCNAAAYRAYYAAYLVVADRALCDGRSFDGGRSAYFRHDALPGNARLWGILNDELSEDLSWLQGLRVKADYAEDQVELEEATQAARLAEQFVGLLREGT
jgi:uncharacterized protein (UPF0332 family)